MNTPDTDLAVSSGRELTPAPGRPPARRQGPRPRRALFMLATFALGLVAGYLLRDLTPAAAGRGQSATGPPSFAEQVNPPPGYPLPVRFGDLGPRLLAAGAIDLDRFAQVYQQAGHPLTEDQLRILTEGASRPVVITRENAHFLLNLLWAVGLANQNPLLTQGTMMKSGADEIGRFASTGGWTLGTRPPTELYASTTLVTLTPEQQVRLEEVAAAVYRPCCNNPTAFPDCNHGMAMLGLLELLAAQNIGVDGMFEAAKYVNAFWFPQQALETAIFFEATTGRPYAEVDARAAVGAQVFSGAGFGQVHQWLAGNGLLEQTPGSGGSCGT